MFAFSPAFKSCSIKTLEKFILGGVALIGLNFLLKGRAIKNLIFAPGPIQTINFDGASPVVQVAVNIQNTNSIGITIQSLAGNVYANDEGNKAYLGNVYNFSPTVIPGNSQSVIILNLKLSPTGLVNQILQAIQFGNRQKTIDVEGVVNVDGGQFTLPQLSFTAGV